MFGTQDSIAPWVPNNRRQKYIHWNSVYCHNYACILNAENVIMTGICMYAYIVSSRTAYVTQIVDSAFRFFSCLSFTACANKKGTTVHIKSA